MTAKKGKQFLLFMWHPSSVTLKRHEHHIVNSNTRNIRINLLLTTGFTYWNLTAHSYASKNNGENKLIFKKWDDNEVYFVLDQQAEVDFYCASWLTCALSLKIVIVLSTISSLMTYYQVYNKSTTTGASRGAGTAYPSKTHELIRVTQSVVFWRPVYVFALFILVIVLSFVLRFTTSDYLFAIFKLVYVLFLIMSEWYVAKPWDERWLRNVLEF